MAQKDKATSSQTPSSALAAALMRAANKHNAPHLREAAKALGKKPPAKTKS